MSSAARCTTPESGSRTPARPSEVSYAVRERVLGRIRAALEAGDDAEAMRIARELGRRWRTAESRRGPVGEWPQGAAARP